MYETFSLILKQNIEIIVYYKIPHYVNIDAGVCTIFPINFLSSEEISESLSVGKLSVNLKDESIEGILGISLALAFKVICVIV